MAALLRFFPIWFGLEHPRVRPDEETAAGYAVQVLGGHLNPDFFHWPSLIFYALAAVYGTASLVRSALFGDGAFTTADYMLIGRGFVALAGTLTVVVLFRLGRRIADATTGLLAALFLSVAILHVRESHFVMTDVVMTLLVCASLALLLRAFDGAAAGTARDVTAFPFASAGLVGGLAASTKYNAAAVAASMVAAQLLLAARWRGEAAPLRAWLPLSAYAIAFALGFLAGTPYALLDFETFSADLRYDFTHLASAHAVDVGRGWWYHISRSLPYGAGWSIFIAAVVGVVPFAARHRPHVAIVGAFAATFYLAIGSGYTVFFRYVLPLVPVLCLFAAVAVRSAAPWIAARTRASERAVLVALTLAVAGPALVNSLWLDVLLARTDTRVLAARWLTPQLRAGDSLHDTGSEYARLHLPVEGIHDWQYDESAGRFGLAETLAPDWLVLQDSPLRAYARTPARLRQLAAERYVLVWSARATSSGARRTVYDQQDAFFLPISGFGAVERPGPNISIHRRRDVAQPRNRPRILPGSNSFTTGGVMGTRQGSVSLIHEPSVQPLLQSPIPARLAYTWTDGSPRVVPIWFHWNGNAFVLGTPVTAPKLKALAKDPRVALTIDENGFPARVLLVRGSAAVETVDGVIPEYASSAVRYLGDAQGHAWVGQATQMFRQMARITIRPEWVGFLDFQSRFPSAIEKAMGAA